MNKKVFKISFVSLSLIITLISVVTICSAYLDNSNTIETNQELLEENYQGELIIDELSIGRHNLTDEERNELTKKNVIESYERTIKEIKEKYGDKDEEILKPIYELMQQTLDSIDEK